MLAALQSAAARPLPAAASAASRHRAAEAVPPSSPQTSLWKPKKRIAEQNKGRHKQLQRVTPTPLKEDAADMHAHTQLGMRLCI